MTTDIDLPLAMRMQADGYLMQINQLSEEKQALERRIDELCAENERLRERLKKSDEGRERQANNLIDKYHKIARLQTENAKLRELAKQMHKAVRELQDTFDASVVVEGVELSAEHFEVELNKLGIEVDE